MTHAQVEASLFVEEEHPRAQGGQFGTKSKTTTKPARKAAPAKTTPKKRGRTRRTIPAGQLGFDGVRGTGYGVKGGDKRVRALQEQLNRLGLTDSRGRKLRIDGELGPLTTQAIKAAQLRLGMRPTGIIAPAFIARLKATKAMPAPKRAPVKAPVRKASAKRASPRVRAKYDPTQMRDDHGRWSKIGAALHEIGQLWSDAGSVQRHEVFGGPEGSSDSHGIIAYHGDDEFSINLHDKDVGTSGTMWLHSDELGDLEYDLQRALEAEEPGEVTTDRYRIVHDENGLVLHANIDDDSALEKVYLSRDDAQSLIEASELSRSPLDREDPSFSLPLRQGEVARPRSRKRLGKDDEFVGAMQVVDTTDGPRVRLGAIAQGDDGIKSWTGGRGKTTVDLDQEHAAKLAEMLERFDALQRERQKIYDKHTKAAERREYDDEDVDWNEVDAAIRAELPQQGMWDAAGEGARISTFEDDYNRELIGTPWGTIRLTDVGMDDEANVHDRHVKMEIWPAGMTEAEYDAGQSPTDGPSWAWPGAAKKYQKPDPNLRAKDVRALIKVLRETFAAPVAAASKTPYGPKSEVDYADPSLHVFDNGICITCEGGA